MKRARRSGLPYVERRKRPITDRIASMVERVTESGCWIWMRRVASNGYGQISVGDKNLLAHRVSYEAHKGPIAEGMHVDHLCNVTCCVNPDHLRVVTPRVNVLRSTGPCASNLRKTHCRAGHPLEGENVHVTAEGWRICKSCRRSHGRAHDAKRRCVEVAGSDR